MNATLQKALAFVAVSGMCLSQATFAADGQGSGKTSAKTRHHVARKKEEPAVTAQDLEQLKDMIQAQQQQIDQLRQQLQQREQQLGEVQSAAQAAQDKAVAAQNAANEQKPVVSRMQGELADVKTTVSNTAAAAQDAQKRANEVETKESKLSDLAHGKVKIGGTFYGDYAFYKNTGFGPQFFTQANQPGPGNGGFNSFDITRAYINFFYTPNDAVTLRFTPNIYRQVDVSAAQSMGKGSAIGSSSNGNLGIRLKYAYVDFNTLFSGTKAFKKDKLTLGQTTNPLIDWEEGLYGYRFVSLVPWNYLSLSSTYTGVTLHGPIELNGKEYLDYHLGVFNTASFHAIEQNDKKQFMGRLTWYPFGTTSDRSGFGVTAFEDYGYSTKTPDTKSTPINRLALLVHYQTLNKAYGIAGEYDLGRNAFGTGNMFSGVGPADQFGLGPTSYATFSALSSAILNGDHTRQQGFDFFGHARIKTSPYTVFGMYQYFQPNTNISGTNPLDFQRIVAGVSYKYNKHLEFALDSQNLKYTHGQFTMPASQIATFSTSLAAANPSGIANAVPQNTNAIMLNMQFNY